MAEKLCKKTSSGHGLIEAIRSTLGPKGLDKLLIDDEGRTLVTNDGVTVLETAKVEHPVAKMMINASSTQDRIAKDGTTSTVICGRNCKTLAINSTGNSPSTIARGYENPNSIFLSVCRKLYWNLMKRYVRM